MRLSIEELKNISVEELENIKFSMLFEKDRLTRILNTACDEKGIDKDIIRELMTTDGSLKLYHMLKNEEYHIKIPRIKHEPKDNGKVRELWVNEKYDRVFFTLYSDMMNELHGYYFISKYCKSYQKGISCPSVVKEVSKKLTTYNGYKADMTQYFDSTPIGEINKLFDKLRMVTKVDLPVREYYSSNLVYDVDGTLIERYAGMKQGCAFSTFLANALLYDIDEMLGNIKGLLYVRYSDDILFVGKDSEKAKGILEYELNKMGLQLNPNKTEKISNEKWFDFLGFRIKGSHITFSKKSIKKIITFVLKNTIKYRYVNKKGKVTYINSKQKAINIINSHLYKNFTINNKKAFGWGEYFLKTVNVVKDLIVLDEWIKDCIRACQTKKIKIGCIGMVNGKDFTLYRPRNAKDVYGNKIKTGEIIQGYTSMVDMWNTINDNKNTYRLKARMM